MDAQKRTRSCNRQRPPRGEGTPGGARQIVISMTRETYESTWNDPRRVRQELEAFGEACPERCPPGFEDGFQLAGFLPESRKMPGIRLRQVILANGQRYYLRPSFVFSYMTGTVDELEHPLLLLSIGTPCWIVAQIFGHNDMFWQRHLERLGRSSLVGATVSDPARLPPHVAADEHHAKWRREKGYVAVTAGGGCILGAALTEAADEQHLTEAYGVFQAECRQINPAYAPETVNVDGWFATQNTFLALFPGIAVILCFLHGVLKIRDRCRKAHDLHARVWDAYHAATSVDFLAALDALKAWVAEGSWSKPIVEMVAKLIHRGRQYAASYDHPGCHRTSNLVDRLMNRMTRFLYAGRGLHGHQHTCENRLRGWALLQNFRPFAPRSNLKREYNSPAHRFNQRQYHANWLHNLQISTSLLGCHGNT